jgi:uncharacterized surface protein with fasciclin (FAS1) repeats
MRRLIALTITIALVTGVGATTAGAAPTIGAGEGQNVVETAVAAGDFETLVSLVKKAGLAKTLSGPGPFTVFAPTDAAFAKVPKATLATLAKNRKLLRAVLLYHVLAGEVPSSEAVKLKSAETLQGDRIRLRVRKGSLVINGNAKVIAPDVMASNGVIHVLNRVLLPPA